MKPHTGFIWVKVLTVFSENNTGPALQNNKQFLKAVIVGRAEHIQQHHCCRHNEHVGGLKLNPLKTTGKESMSALHIVLIKDIRHHTVIPGEHHKHLSNI